MGAPLRAGSNPMSVTIVLLVFHEAFLKSGSIFALSKDKNLFVFVSAIQCNNHVSSAAIANRQQGENEIIKSEINFQID